MNIDNCVKVSDLNRYIKTMMEFDDFLSCVAVRGEISNFKRNISGHLYFSLKDDDAAVSVVMFKSSAVRLNFVPSDGMKVTLYGRVSVYEKTGQYQIYAQSMVEDGVGDLARAYEALKRKLEAEGLFDQDKKREIPSMPKRIGIVTSPTGAAIRDILNVTGRRYPLADILIFPAAVQGAEAPAQLLTGIGYFNAMNNVDVIIIGRGGGSIEDLWAFNDEALVRAVAASDIPVISAVGHEIDFTLCDFAADRRAPTPSAAAEIAVPDRYAIGARIAENKNRLMRAMTSRIAGEYDNAARLEKMILLNSPASKLERLRLGIGNLCLRLDTSLQKHIADSKGRVSEMAARLDGLNPLSVLSRGYSAVQNDSGRMVGSARELTVGEKVSIIMSDGSAEAEISKVVFTHRAERNKNG